MIKTYSCKDTVDVQLRAVGLSFQYGYSIWGLAPKGKVLTTKKNRPWWLGFFPKVDVRLNYHTHDNGVWRYFYVDLFGVFAFDICSRREMWNPDGTPIKAFYE